MENIGKQEGRIIQSKSVLNRHQPFFARILLNMYSHEVKDKDAIPTMGVNKFGHLFWNPDFVDELSDEELKGALAHEALHVALLTFERQQWRDNDLWNIATDIAINYILIESGFTLPETSLIPKEGTITIAELTINVKEMSAEEIYEKLEKHIEDHTQKFGFDVHLEGDSDGQGGNTGESTGVDGEGNAVKKVSSQENQSKWKQVLANSATYAKERGTLSDSVKRICNDILEPKLNWKQLLNQFITRDLPFNYSMARPNRKFISTGIYQPITIKENLEIVIGVDVSGSISNDEYAEFASEIVGICTSFEQINARVLFWSTRIAEGDDIVIDNNTDLMDSINSNHSSGGTELSCVAEYLRKQDHKTSLFVCLTDGYVEENPTLPENATSLFVISKDGSDEILKEYGICCPLRD